MKRLLLTLVAGVGVLSAGALEVEALLIDSFDDTPQTVDTITSGPFAGVAPDSLATDTASGEAVGGERDLRVTGQNPPGGFGDHVSGIVNTTTGRYTFSESSGVDGGFEITWDGDDDDATSLDPIGLQMLGIGVDLTNGGQFDRFGFRAASTVDFELAVIVHTNGGQSSTGTITLENTGGTTTFEFFELLFSDFTGTADFSDVGAVQIIHTADSVAGGTLSLDFVQTLPEPSSIALLGMGAFGLIGYGWRRKKKQQAA